MTQLNIQKMLIRSQSCNMSIGNSRHCESMYNLIHVTIHKALDIATNSLNM